MKRIVSFIIFLALLITMVSTVAFADAAGYDIEMADYYVYVATPDGGLNMRQGPGVEYNKVMEERIPDGVMLHIEMTSGDWGYTTYNENYGWVALKQTTTTPPGSSSVELKDDPDTTPISESEPESRVNNEDQSAIREQESENEPQLIEEPFNESSDVDDFNNSEKTGNNPMSSQMMMIAVLILLIIALAIVAIIIINVNSRK